MSSDGTKHEYYEVLNLLGYGLAKFDMSFTYAMGFETKTALYESLVSRGLVETTDVVKNRQDMFDPFFDNGRRGWWQRKDDYSHRKKYIDELYGDLDVNQYAEKIKMRLAFSLLDEVAEGAISAIANSHYGQKQIEKTGNHEIDGLRNLPMFDNGNNGTKHEHYVVLNLLGYGLAKFDLSFANAMGFDTKTALYENMVLRGLVETESVVKNRQDMFDPFFDNGRMGWWQRKEDYIHRKKYIDNLYGHLEVNQYAEVVKMHLAVSLQEEIAKNKISPIISSSYRQMQFTGREAEIYFIEHYEKICRFENGILVDARLDGDGYDFEIKNKGRYLLAEVKGIKSSSGSIRFTENEYEKAQEYTSDYGLVIVSNLAEKPKMTPVFDPVHEFKWEKRTQDHTQVTYHSQFLC